MSQGSSRRPHQSARQSYTGGHFELAIDGHPSTAYLKSVTGGHVKAAGISEPIGPANEEIKHTSVREIATVDVEFGISGADQVLKWIQQSWQKKFGRRNGEIRHGDFDLNQVLQHEFFDALIAETTFPTLDGASKDAAYIKVKFAPENAFLKKANGGKLSSNLGAKQKLWTCSSFAFELGGNELSDMKYTNKIESFTIKQGISKLYVGEHKIPQLEPCNIKFPNLKGSIALAYADQLLAWADKVRNGNDPANQKIGAIHFLGPDKDVGRPLFSVKLEGVGLLGVTIPQSTANSDSIKRVEFELQVESMRLDGGSGFESGLV